VEGDHDPEFYGNLLQLVPDLPGELMQKLQREAEEGLYHPLGRGDTAGFLRSVVGQLSSHGTFVDSPTTATPGEHPLIVRNPVVVLRKRTLGFPLAISHVLEDIENGSDLPPSLVRIVGVEPARADAQDEHNAGSAEEVEDVLFTKPANLEQVRIARQLERQHAVLVQGPPGTGKSHTIANLIGHLIACGRRVLVTSHTTKALRVLRGHVVEALRPLCVSVLDNDMEGRRQLELAVETIVQGLTTQTKESLREEAERLAEQRSDILEQIRVCRANIALAREQEYRAIVLAGEPVDPSQAARETAAAGSAHAWLPGPLDYGAPLPLSHSELEELYDTNAALSPDEESDLGKPLPAVEDLPSSGEFRGAVEAAKPSEADQSAHCWRTQPSPGSAQDLDSLLAHCDIVAQTLAAGQHPYRIAVLAAAQAGGSAAPWQKLLQEIQRGVELANSCHELEIQYQPILPSQEAEDVLAVLEEILVHLQNDGELGWFAKLRNPAWKAVIQESRVKGKPPKLPAHFAALRASARLQVHRSNLGRRWNMLVAEVGGPSFETLPSPPEDACGQYVSEIDRLLRWWLDVWASFEAALEKVGFNWSMLLESQPPNTERFGSILRIGQTVEGPLRSTLQARRRAILRFEAEGALSELRRFLEGFEAGVVRDALAAVSSRDPTGYDQVLERLRMLLGKRKLLERRRLLLDKLAPAAPGWAKAIARRELQHGGSSVPGQAEAAWRWRQLAQELDRRAKLDEQALSARLESLQDQLRRTTARMVDRFTWVAQHEHTSLPQQQALVGWVQAVKKVGKGTGRRAPQLLAEARKKMAKARTAVPVWIMPLSRVAESFDPRDGKFDVVIIDEASQSDVMGLLAFYLGKRVVVVGDHEQVSPSAVGQDLDQTTALINQLLADIPNRDLYDGRTSIYDLAQQSFGGTITLTEHFRCVTPIIEFSNKLSYNGKIRPLREGTDALAPHLLDYVVSGGAYERRINDAEARMVTALIGAAIEQPEYAGKSMGVVSLLGEEQAIEIQKLLSHRLPPTELERRHVLCGNAAQFQGDERDVMFLSMVHGPTGGPLAFLDRAEFKQRYNVAASRARDQLWLVHSLNPEVDLKPGDLRRRLIDHVRDPDAYTRDLAKNSSTTESHFEKEVLEHLLRAGFRVTCQFPVGFYRIDLVVEGRRGRVAIECDGDKYHPLEQIPHDMARQAILERLGWRFIRIRGSTYFRSKEKTMEWVFAELSKREIEPLGVQAGDADMPAAHAELRDRIVRRAHELLRLWYPDEKADGAEDAPTM
jgi:very-short-patch-repair endonuclease